MEGRRSSGYRRRTVLTVIAVALAVVLTAGAAVLHFLSIPKLAPFLDGFAIVKPLGSLDSKEGSIKRYAISLSRGEARAWVYPDGSVFWCERLDYVWQYDISETLTIELDGFSSADAYHLSDDPRSPLLILGEGRSALIQPPLTRERETLDGTNYVASDSRNGTASFSNGTARISYTSEAADGRYYADWWVYLTPNDLTGADGTLDWLYACTVDKFGDANRMTLDGYYYKTPTDYIPTGDNYYYLNPAAYIASKLARQTDSTDGMQVAAAMLDLQREHYVDAGFVPTLPTSGWLSTDYGVGAGFYDTRFNTELALALLTLGENLEIDEFAAEANAYADFLLDHAATCSTETVGGGILVDDYSHPLGSERTHTSLNHQLAEILFLYLVGTEEATATADRMLAGVEATVGDWIRPDSNLHYARYPDGSFGGVDYPYLTYNDLLALDRYLGGNDALRRLMAAKKAWMDANGVTDYNK